MFERTYAHTVLMAADISGAMLIWNRHDITISSMARIAHLASEDREDGLWKARLASMKLWPWQERFLLWLEPRLGEKHCEGARLADIERALAALDLLGA